MKVKDVIKSKRLFPTQGGETPADRKAAKRLEQKYRKSGETPMFLRKQAD